ncbi:glycoside hydrolase family 63, partial [Metarhizium brunneum ARSEF 3297]
MAHYFDDMLQRGLDLGTPRSPSMRRIRRSSTARSIGARSDFEASANGVDDDAHSVTNSVIHDDSERAREREEADSHLHRYISDQLERYKDESVNGGHADEYETKA